MTAENDALRQFRRFRRLASAVGWMPRWAARLYTRIHTRVQLAVTDYSRVREIVTKNLEPVVGAAEAPRVARRTMLNYGFFLNDYFRIPAMTPAWVPRMLNHLTGEEHLTAALAAGKGAILVTPHLGNWELGGIFLRLRGSPLTVVAVPDSVVPGITLFRDWARKGHGIDVVNLEPGNLSPLTLVRALEANRVVAMLGERNFFEADPVEVDFFGRRTKFPRGAALLSIATGAPLLPGFVTFGRRGRYDSELTPAIAVPASGTKAEKAAEMTRRLAKIFEDRIRAHPDQWFIFDPYWGDGEPISNIARAVAGKADGGIVSPLR